MNGIKTTAEMITFPTDTCDDYDEIEKLMAFIQLAPFTSEILENGHLAVKDKNGELVMILGPNTIEKRRDI